jgi:hypothetical protein
LAVMAVMMVMVVLSQACCRRMSPSAHPLLNVNQSLSLSSNADVTFATPERVTWRVYPRLILLIQDSDLSSRSRKRCPCHGTPRVV